MTTEHITWSPGVTLEAIERQVIAKAFNFYRQNKTATATALGISVRTLDNKFEKYALDDQTETERDEVRRQRAQIELNRARGLTPDGRPIDHTATRLHRKPKAQANGAGPKDGLRVESIADAPAQSPVPMPKREEVQSVLPTKAAANGNGKRR